MSSEIRPTLLLLSEWGISPQIQCRTNVFRRFFLLFALNPALIQYTVSLKCNEISLSRHNTKSKLNFYWKGLNFFLPRKRKSQPNLKKTLFKGFRALELLKIICDYAIIL